MQGILIRAYSVGGVCGPRTVCEGGHLACSSPCVLERVATVCTCLPLKANECRAPGKQKSVQQGKYSNNFKGGGYSALFPLNAHTHNHV